MPKTIQILMATYNGERFLSQQLDSIAAQAYPAWELVACDDGSKDSTLDILHAFQKQQPGRVTILNNPSRLGPAGNFKNLLKQSTAPIISFADQDDIWHRNKLERSVQKIESIEHIHGENTPVLVHHDFTCIDKNNDRLVDSYDAKYHTRKAHTTLNRVFFETTAHGFSITASRALVDKALPLPAKVDGHDNHLIRVATVFGHVGYISEPLVNYRLHDNNRVGTKSPFRFSSEDFSLRNLANGHTAKRLKTAYDAMAEKLQRNCEYASCFLERYRDEIPPEKRIVIEDFSRLADAPSLERKALIVKHRLFPGTPAQAAAFLALS